MFKNGFAYVHHQLIHIVGGGASGVHHEAGVFLAHLRTAHGKALQPRLLDKRGGEMPLRSAKRTPRRGQIKRLLVAATLVEFAHLRGDLRAVASFAPDNRAEKYAAAHLLKQTLSVAEAALFVCKLVKSLLRQVVENDALHHVLHLSAVGAGVHHQSAAHRAGYAGGKLQPRKRILLRKARKLGKRHARLDIDISAVEQKHFGKLLGADHEKLAQPLVGEEDVCAVAENVRCEMVQLQIVAYL